MNINATLLAEMVVFASFVGLTRVYVWPPIIEIIDERRRIVREGNLNAEKAHEMLKNSEQKRDEIIREAKKKYAEIVDNAEQMKADILEDAREEAHEIRAQQIAAAQDGIKEQIRQEKLSLQKNTLNYVENVLQKVIVKLPDQPQLNTMIDQAIGEVDVESQ